MFQQYLKDPRRLHAGLFWVVLIVVLIQVTFLSGAAFSTEQNSRSLPTGTIQRIAFGSCAKHWQPQPIWNAVIESNPDLWLFLGDAIYADTDGKTTWQVTKEQLAGEWGRLADKPEFQKARKKIPMMATWDNHDYGSHAGGVEFPLKDASKKIFLDFFGEPENSERRKTSGIYDAKIFGPEGRRVQIILLDTRYFKDPYKQNPLPKEAWLKSGKVGGYIPNVDPSKNLLGQEQWAWLEDQLKKPAEVRLIASSIQIIANEKGMDEWGNFPLERQKLVNLFGSTKANGVILLSGNVHFAEISKTNKGPYPFFELTSSGMTHVNEVYAAAPNSHRVKGPFTETNFGLVKINWDATPSPVISLAIISTKGDTIFYESIPLSDLSNSR